MPTVPIGPLGVRALAAQHGDAPMQFFCETEGVAYRSELPDRLLDLRHTLDAGIHTYSCSADLALDAVWPGLWEQAYPEDEDLNPWLRFGINNGDGEPGAVWRSFAWAITSGTTRYLVPNYYGDASARALGLDPGAVDLVDWEYDVDVAQPAASFEVADRGFVRARHVVPIRPKPSKWERSTRDKARLFPVEALSDLHRIAPVVSEATSEITIFALAGPDRHDALLRTLRGSTRPTLSAVLGPGDVLVDIAIEHDGFGRSHLSARSAEPLAAINELAAHYGRSFQRYVECIETIETFSEFVEAVEQLTSPPGNTMGT